MRPAPAGLEDGKVVLLEERDELVLGIPTHL